MAFSNSLEVANNLLATNNLLVTNNLQMPNKLVPPFLSKVLTTIQTVSQDNQNLSGVTHLALPAKAAAGNSLYVAFADYSVGVTSVVDDLGTNVYTLVSGPDIGNNGDLQMFLYKCENLVGTPKTITITLDSTDNLVGFVAEVHSSTSFPQIDHVAFSDNKAATTWSGAAVSAAVADIVLAIGASLDGASPVYTAGSGWTMLNVLQLTNPDTDTGGGFIEDQAVSSAGNYTPTVNNAEDLGEGMYSISLK